jgi:hypothetical protein
VRRREKERVRCCRRRDKGGDIEFQRKGRRGAQQTMGREEGRGEGWKEEQGDVYLTTWDGSSGKLICNVKLWSGRTGRKGQ